MTFALALTLLGLAAGIVLLADLRTPAGSLGPARPSVTVIIPARNEAASLPNLLRSLQDQTVAPDQVLVVDDGSTDETAAVARAAGATVIHAPPPPAGWIGKSWACHLGSMHASGAAFVFLDADVVVAPDGLERILATWRRSVPGGLLSVQPFHTTHAAYEQLSAYPNLMAMMSSGAFVPFHPRWSPVAFGPCLVTAAADYRAVGGHEAVAGEVIEDVHLARAYGAAGRDVETLAGGSAVSFRMYPGGVQQLIDGWTKNLAGGPRLVSAVPMLGAVAFLVASIVVASDLVQALAAAATGDGLRWLPVAMWALVAAEAHLLLRRIGRFSWWAALAFPVLLAGFVAVFARSAFHRTVRRSVSWHDRSVSVR